MDVDNDIKINLKYLVFLNDDNLLGVFRKGYTNIDDLKNEIRIIGKNLDQDDLEEMFKDENLFQISNGNSEENKKEDNKFDLGLISSPISSYLQDAKKRKQRMDKPVDDFQLEPPSNNRSHQEDNNTAIMQCDVGASPKINPASRRKR